MIVSVRANLTRRNGAEVNQNGCAVSVAVAFSCVRAKSVSMRGVVVCPQPQTSLLLSGFGAGESEALEDGAVKERRAGRNWVKKHFDLVDPPASRVQFPPFGFKRYLAFARFRDIAVSDNRLNVGFDIFVGPGDYPLLGHDGNKPRVSARAINGFADISHYPVFDYEVAKRQGGAVTGHAALCLVEQPNDLFSDGWRLRSDGVLNVVTEDKVGAMLLVEATAHGRERSMGFDSDPVVRHEVGDTPERGFIFRARLIVKLPKVADKKVVGL